MKVKDKRCYMLHLLFTLLKANKGPNYFYKPAKQTNRKIRNPFALLVLIFVDISAMHFKFIINALLTLGCII